MYSGVSFAFSFAQKKGMIVPYPRSSRKVKLRGSTASSLSFAKLNCNWLNGQKIYLFKKVIFGNNLTYIKFTESNQIESSLIL